MGQRLLIAGLIALLLALNVLFWRTDGTGLRELRELRLAIQQQQASNALLEERNRRLEAEVADLKLGLEAIEERARTDLGMVRDGELFYRVLQDEPPAAGSGR